jgi:hypothetical protein
MVKKKKNEPPSTIGRALCNVTSLHKFSLKKYFDELIVRLHYLFISSMVAKKSR